MTTLGRSILARTSTLALSVAGFAAAASTAFGQASDPFGGRFVDVLRPLECEAADLDGDGDPDLASLTSNGLMHIRLNQGGGAMGPDTTYNVGASPQSLALADWDFDTDLDLFVTDLQSGGFTAWRNTGNGTFVGAGGSAVCQAPYGIQAGFLNGDALLDLVVAGGTNTTNVFVLLGTTPGAFAPPVPYATGGVSRDLCIADLDGDGIQDLAVCHVSTTTVSTLIGLGNGTFGPPTNLEPGFADDVEALDMDGDGDLDIAATVASSAVVYWNAGNASYPTSSSVFVGFNTTGLASSDLDGNFEPELAVACSNDGTVCIVQRAGGTALVVKSVAWVGEQPAACALADIDGDGRLDLATADLGADAIAWFPGRGDATFAAAGRAWNSTSLLHVVAGDFTGDGIADIAAQNNLQVVLARGLGDGQFMPLTVANQFGFSVSNLAAGDLDGDLDLDIAVARHETVPYALLFNNGAGAFTPVITSSSPWVSADLALGDLDADGDLDLVCGGHNDFSVHLNQGAGTFAAGTAYPTGITVSAVALGDLDGDLDLDVALAGSGRLMVRLNSGSGAFGAMSVFLGGGQMFDLALGDIDQDGDLDAACASFDYALYRNAGNGTFTYSFLPEAHWVTASKVADIDADGIMDLIGVNEDGSVSVRASNTSGTFAAPRTFAGPGNPQDLVLADFDQDQDLDVATTTGILLNRGIEPPRVYCHGIPNSHGCTPAMGFTGLPSASAPASFSVTGANVLNQKPGLLLYALHASSLPLMAGTLCVGPVVRRTGGQSSGGSGLPTVDCSGTFGFDFNALIQSGSNPALVPGVEVFCQYWSRDPNGVQFVSFSNALAFRIRP